MSNDESKQEIKTTVVYSADLKNGNRIEMFICKDGGTAFTFYNNETKDTTKLSMSEEGALTVAKMINEVVAK